MLEAEPLGLKLCVDCPLRLAAKVVSEGFSGTAGFDGESTLHYQGYEKCGYTAGKLAGESLAVRYPTTAADINACERPRLIEEDVKSGWRRIFGLSKVVEVEQCGALYESELAKIIEDIIERNRSNQ